MHPPSLDPALVDLWGKCSVGLGLFNAERICGLHTRRAQSNTDAPLHSEKGRIKTEGPPELQISQRQPLTRTLEGHLVPISANIPRQSSGMAVSVSVAVEMAAAQRARVCWSVVSIE